MRAHIFTFTIYMYNRNTVTMATCSQSWNRIVAFIDKKKGKKSCNFANTPIRQKTHIRTIFLFVCCCIQLIHINFLKMANSRTSFFKIKRLKIHDMSTNAKSGFIIFLEIRIWETNFFFVWSMEGDQKKKKKWDFFLKWFGLQFVRSVQIGKNSKMFFF